MEGNYGDLGISKDRLGATIGELNSNIEVVKESLNNFEDLVDKTNSFMNGDVGVSFRTKSSKYIFAKSIVNSNLESYVEDLSRLLNNYINYENSYAVDNDL